MHFLVSILLCAAPGPVALIPVDKANLEAQEEGTEGVPVGADADRITVWPPPKGTSATLIAFVWSDDAITRKLLFELSAIHAEQRGNGVRLFAVDNTPAVDDLKLLPLSFPLLVDDAHVAEHFGMTLELIPSLALLGPRGEVKALAKGSDRAGLDALLAQLPKPKRVPEKERVPCAERLVKRAQRGEVSSLDLRGAWLYGMRGGLPAAEGQVITEEELAKAKKLGASLKPRTVMEKPSAVEPGDLLVSRLPWEKSGWIRAVRSFDPKTWTAKGLVWDEGKMTLEETEFQLSTDPVDAPERLLRPGLFQLRPSDAAACGR